MKAFDQFHYVWQYLNQAVILKSSNIDVELREFLE